MAQVKIYGLKTHLGPMRSQLSDVIQQALIKVFKFPADKKFQRFFLLEPDDFIFPKDRSKKYTIIEIIMFEGRSIKAKKHLIRLLYELLAASNMSAQDLEIVMIEIPQLCWGTRGVPGDELKLNYQVTV
jgi:hypothetical protein